MNVKNSVVLLIALLFVINFIFCTAIAGDQSDPEVKDTTGDSTSTGEPGSSFRDIEAAWFGPEPTNETLEIHLKMAGAPPGLMDLRQEPSDNYDYEVYFDVDGKGYAVAVTIQYAFSLGGMYSPTNTWTWELRSVSYRLGSDTIGSETAVSEGINSNNFVDNIITWEINKEAVGIGSGLKGRGKSLINTWAAIWNADASPSGSQRDPKTQATDFAHTHHTNPGDSYNIRGVGDIDYNVVLSVADDEKETHGGKPVTFTVIARNNGTDEFLVDFNFNVTSGDESWSVVLYPNSTTIANGDKRDITVTITPPKNVKNGTTLIVKIGGVIHEKDGDETYPILNPVTLKAIGLSSANEDEGGGWFEEFMEMLADNLAIIAGAIAIVVVAIIVLAVLIRR